MAEPASQQPELSLADGETSAPDVNSPEAPSSSDSQGEKPEGSLADFIAEGLANQGAEIDDTPEGAEAAPASEPEPDQEQAEEKAEAEAEAEPEATDGKEVKGDDPEDRRFDKHPRFKKLIADRNELREKTEKLEAQTQEYEADHKAMEQFRGFMREHNLNSDMVNEAIDLRILAETDPNAFLDKVIPVVAQLAQQTGRIPAPEYQQQVDAGTLDRDTAMRLSRERGEAQMQQRHAQRQQESSQQQQYNLATAAIDIVTNLKKSTDPDYDKKEGFYAKELELRMTQAVQQGRIPSVEEAQKMATEAWDSVSQQVLALTPKATQKPMNPQPNGASAPVKREPQSLEEALVAGLEDMGSRVL